MGASGGTSSLAGVEAKLRRADHHLAVLAEEITSYNSDPLRRYSVRPEFETNRMDCFGLLRHREPVPVRWGVILGDAVHNLRSALDHVTFQLWLAAGGEDGSTAARRIHFPVCTDLKHYKKSVRPHLKPMRDSVLTLVDSFQDQFSREGARNSLVTLHDLWNQDKHRVVQWWGVRIVAEASSLDFTVPVATLSFSPGVLQDGDIAYRATLEYPAPVDVNVSGELVTNIAFHHPDDPDPGEVEPLWGLYDDTVSAVRVLGRMLPGSPDIDVEPRELDG